MSLERGTLLHKRYRIVEILGQGGMGSVYRAVDENLGVDVAVKENLFTTDEYSRQFRLEAVILANLRHPNLPRVYDHFVVGDQGQYLVMDFIEGEDLRQRMERLGSVSEDDAVMVGAAMSDALSFLHSRKPPILHRDLKPGNVKITPDGHIFLVDFGLAKVVQGTQATTTGARAMTPGYSPPEQYGTARTDPRTDIYSLGATLYASLCGMIPEDGLARAMDNAQLTPLRKRNPKITRRLAAAIERAMAVDPADRFQTADDFKKALLAAKSKTQRLTGEFTVVPPPDILNPPRTENKDKGDKPEPRGSGLVLPPMMEEKPFVPPKKKKRSGCAVWLLLLLILIAALASVVFFFPDQLPKNVRGFLTPLHLPSFNATATRLIASSPTALAALVSTKGPPSATATQTFTPTSMPVVINTGTGIPAPGTTLTPAAGPTPPGGGAGQIAFASDRNGSVQIYLSDLTGANVTPITNVPNGACQPAWSPDGSKLVFVSPCPREQDISEVPLKDTSLYIINADGSNLVALPTVPGGDLEPAWSPDGKRIAFTSLRDGKMQIYLLNVSDQSVKRLTKTAVDVGTRQPTWSPFNNEIVYAVKRFGVYQIFTMTDTGQGQQQIVRSGLTIWDYLPVWSPDGKMIIFNERNAQGPVAPWVMSMLYVNRAIDSAVKVPLNPLPAVNLHFSPDGSWLVFEGMSDIKNQDIFYTTLTGSQRTRLTMDPGADFQPAWRPVPQH
jgi:eukaryotic-like serine/threonine-protein kinase